MKKFLIMGDILCNRCNTEYNMDEPDCPYCRGKKMTKEELYERWINDMGEDYIFTGGYSEDRENFYQDLEDWYVSRHVKELIAIKAELYKSLAEMDEAVRTAAKDEIDHRKGYDCYD